ncbi:DinB family protein [Hymenobacter cellulosivorans]|uniref:Damage-inducible protein DinB n=1 Tax=Hymenobacter cellulosivorans TaxID=2932249 RepID=A0ABY4F5T5_9BACT|nr:DinB family protein [Hymenobacter cellulosivorans]UOQ52030.1 hypothetical protein MUN80_19980 [Hymenobacter cellulosivorans]
MTTFFEKLFDYNYQSNLRVIEALLIQETKSSSKALELLGHIQQVHAVWNRRAATPGQLEEANLAAGLQDTETVNYQNTLWLIRHASLSELVHYQTTTGLARADSRQDLLFHILNHSTYHRAQIATECRHQGTEPVATDYLLYAWKSKPYQ